MRAGRAPHLARDLAALLVGELAPVPLGTRRRTVYQKRSGTRSLLARHGPPAPEPSRPTFPRPGRARAGGWGGRGQVGEEAGSQRPASVPSGGRARDGARPFQLGELLRVPVPQNTAARCSGRRGRPPGATGVPRGRSRSLEVPAGPDGSRLLARGGVCWWLGRRGDRATSLEALERGACVGEITVTTPPISKTHRRTGFHSVAGGGGLRGLGGWPGGGGEQGTRLPGRPGCRPAGGLAFANRSFERESRRAGEGKGQRYPVLADARR